jgi:hypothetical protein
MTEQAYYRLDELQAMGITEGKLRYLIEQEQVTPEFFMHNERFIIGGYLGNKFIGFAVADYSGLATIHKQLIPELLTKGKVSVKQLLLLQKERIRVIATAYPFQVTMPNRYIESWQSTDLSKLDWQVYPALFMPTENVGVLYQIADMLRGFGGSTGNKVDYRFTDGTPKTELVVLDKELRFANLCLQAADVRPKSLSSVTQHSKDNSTAEIKDISSLILHVMTKLPNHRPAEIWQVLKADHLRETRVYDTDELLEEVGEYELIWTDIYGSPRTLQKRSFFNLFKKLKLFDDCN